MCGIAGILTTESDQNHLERLIQRMQGALQHRGPDDQGVYIAPNRQASLAHTRLSILDLTPAGHQPMSTPDGRYWITFNGEIYNFQQLRSQLEAKGEDFCSRTDTEVILKLYQYMGADCVKQLRGMFAFAIWDDLEKTCFLARDPLGIKPLYYWQSGSTLIFASELRAVLASGLPEICLSREGLYGYLTSGSVPEPQTLIEEVRILEAGHWLFWRAGNVHQSRYWQIAFATESITAPEAITMVRKALIDSLQHHFISDVPVGVFLSGGIDSTAVVALSRQIQSGALNTYSIAFEEKEWNEGDLAQKVADKFGTNHTEYKITASMGRSLLPQFLDAIDQPSIDGFNTFCVSQIARKSGMKVVLSGLGGDELFGGYKSFQNVPRMVRLGQQLQPLQPVIAGIGMGLERWGTSTRLRRLGDFLQQVPSPVVAYRSFRGIFSHWEACQLLKSYFPDRELPARQSHKLDSDDLPSWEDEVSHLEISHYMRNQLLRDSDVMSMVWGLELRVPLVDRTLLETIACIPSQLRLAPSKQLLIQAVPELPEWIVNRPKRGFFFPYEQWMQAEWQDYFRQINCPRHIPLKLWYRRWCLAILQHWWRSISR
ncbi:MAG: asparagine synthase (glutamine-hydrolyzing) [Chlorogloeopsis fritschii C42_A2020_084]|uniref:asparagine synthase (glutamine-hydrolyzing) n=1 Tax=Chlorogloeopsis fritschii TaxID=1124 RepID=UPI0019E1B054|nr:asparagine synthase (glutamine-hydrolyzing) [Chlorogloeopsis fritschii]MBF2004234.1 asparagine synthase (glutamine-hydrolyzing) [Chlorogloeopsis fritschii C42_A2020_084]